MAESFVSMHKRNSSRAGPIELRTAASPARSHRRTFSRSFFNNFNPEDEDDVDGFRTIRVNNYAANAKKAFVSNELRTAKYNVYNMIPKALYEQFKRVSNFYFLIIAVIAYLPDVSPTIPITQSLPLLVVVGFGFARDIYEDLKRASTDRKSNARPKILLSRENPALPIETEPTKKGALKKSNNTSLPEEEALLLRSSRLNPADHIMVPSRDISVGDVVLVRKGETFACDMVLLKSSAEGGVAYVSTANLDGESNLKRAVVAEAVASVNAVEELRRSRAVIRVQQPAPILHEFDAKMQSGNEVFTPLDSSNLLLRGSILRNTEYIYGVAVYTGYDTKVALNMRHPPSKMGDIEKKLNWVVLLLFIFLMIIVIVSSGVSGFVQNRFGQGQWYMSTFSEELGRTAGFRGLGTFLILFSTFIPVSLFVTLEFVRLVQGVFISADPRLKTGDQAAVARSTNLNETLGTIQHILTDKTGTLTENVMRYVACSAGGHIYDIMQRRSAMRRAIAKDVKEVKRLVWAMALCHSVVPEPKSESETRGSSTPTKDFPRRGILRRRNGDSGSDGPESGNSSKPAQIPDGPPDYQGQSPDEVALVTVARDYGVALLRRTMNTCEIDNFGTKESYRVLAELEFNSDRKRMSVILDCPDGKIRVISKGADTIMLDLLEKDAEIPTIQAHVDHFAKQGLRTLIFASKVIPRSKFDAWNKDFVKARSSLENREELVGEVSARIEQDLEYLAVTAVEDKLQDRVPETIKFMREADIRLWVLTGDKRETAENIGYSANLLDRMMAVVHIRATNKTECLDQMNQALIDHCGSPSIPQHRKSESLNSLNNLVNLRKKAVDLEKEMGIIIDGASLKYAIEEYPDTFMQLADHAKTVICCRVTPLQKALCVRMVRELRQSMTLAIGDGGNDVSMIQEAHVGVGIFGKEGTQAARSGDYAIGEFKHLRQLVAVHGRYSQIRTAGLINLCFYKNLFFTLTQVYFQLFCFVSGTTFNNQWLTSAFNVVVTSMSPFVYGIFEKDLDEATLYRFPRAYASSRDRGCFSIQSVAEYAVLYGGWHSVVVFFGVFFCFGYLKINHSDGLDSGFDLVAFVVTTLIVCMSLFKFFFHTYIQNLIFYLTLILSFGFYALLVPLSVMVVNEQPLNGLIPMMIRAPSFWITAAVIFVAGFAVDFFVLMMRRLLYPDTTYALQKWEQQQRRKNRALKGGAQL